MEQPKRTFTVVGDADVLKQIRAKAGPKSFACSTPYAFQAPAPARLPLLAPPEMIKLLKAATIAFAPGDPGTAFVAALLGVLRMSPAAKLSIRDARSNHPLGTIDGSMTEQQVKTTLGLGAQ